MIEDLLAEIGIEDIRGVGDEIQARCPAHEKRTGERERHPRHWSVNRRTGAHHCFSCEFKGSLISLIVEMAKVGLWDAHRLMHKYDVVLESGESIGSKDVWVPPVAAPELEDELARFGVPPDRAIERRRLKVTAVERFGLRWNYEDPSWIFPIHGPAGDLWGWQAKSSEWVRNRPPGIRKSRTLFGLQVPQDSSRVTLVESPLDAVYLAGMGYSAVASFGAAVSDSQMHLVIEHFDELVVALDNDAAGKNETKRLLTERWHHRIPIQIFDYGSSKGKDPGELEPHQVKAAMDDLTLAAFW